jgi:Transposase, Mutator family
VRLVISDAHEGLKAAIGAALLGAAWQRCRVDDPGARQCRDGSFGGVDPPDPAEVVLRCRTYFVVTEVTPLSYCTDSPSRLRKRSSCT